MLYSMTGFGRAEGAAGARQVAVDIKTLNGKSFEIISKLPVLLRAWELDVRSLLAGILLRGTADVSITITQNGLSRPMSVNLSLAKFYYNAMQQLARELQVPEQDILPTILRMPEVIAPDAESLSTEDWQGIRRVIEEAATKLMEHRRQEGIAVEQDMLGRIAAIEARLQEILPLESQRSERVRQRLRNGFKDGGIEHADANRFEQEIIYYLEKIDFSEEKQRLTQHLAYFREVAAKKDIAKGKVLGFVLQEIGREINTLGSKASDAAIQQIVVAMKDELEKAKEQVLNVL